MGVDIENKNGVVTVHGKGLLRSFGPLSPPGLRKQRHHHPLISGILAAQDFSAVLTGDASIRIGPWAGSSPLFP